MTKFHYLFYSIIFITLSISKSGILSSESNITKSTSCSVFNIYAETNDKTKLRDLIIEDNPNLYPLLYTQLKGNKLKYHLLELGSEVKLNSVIDTPYFDNNAYVLISFKRNDIRENFIDEIFIDNNTTIAGEPYYLNGIELILTEDQMIIGIHSGVIFNLKNSEKLLKQ